MGLKFSFMGRLFCKLANGFAVIFSWKSMAKGILASWWFFNFSGFWRIWRFGKTWRNQVGLKSENLPFLGSNLLSAHWFRTFGCDLCDSQEICFDVRSCPPRARIIIKRCLISCSFMIARAAHLWASLWPACHFASQKPLTLFAIVSVVVWFLSWAPKAWGSSPFRFAKAAHVVRARARFSLGVFQW